MHECAASCLWTRSFPSLLSLLPLRSKIVTSSRLPSPAFPEQRLPAQNPLCPTACSIRLQLARFPAGPGSSCVGDTGVLQMSYPGPKVQMWWFRQRKPNAMRIIGTKEKICSFSKPPAHRTPLVPSGYHRCLVTAEICLPEAGTREYFWPN